MTTNGPLDFRAVIEDTSFMQSLQRMERKVLGLTQTTERETARIDASFRRLGQVAVGAFAFRGLEDLPQQILKVRSAFEALEISLTTILRSREKANALLQDVTQFAGESPFGLKEAADGAKQLLAYGFAAEETVPILRKLSDIAAGLGLPISRLTYLYGSAKVSGRLFAEDLNQWLDANVPLIKALSEQFQVTEDRVKGLVTQGKVGFREVEKAITSLTSGTGIFAGLTEAQSKSINAMKERLGDAYEQMLNQIGKDNQGMIAGVISTMTEAVVHYQNFVDILKVLVGAYGGLRAALVLESVVQKVRAASADKEIAAAAARLPLLRAEVSALAEKKTQLVQVASAQSAALATARAEAATAQAAALNAATLLDTRKRDALIKSAEVAQNNVLAAQEVASASRKRAIAAASEFYAARQTVAATATTAAGLAENRLSAAQALRLSVTQALTRAQLAFNASIFANPIVLAGTAIAALATAYFVLYEETKKVKTAQDILADTSREVVSKFSQQSGEAKGLIKVIQNQNVAESERLKAYNKLNSIAPEILSNLSFEKAKVADLTKATNDYLVSLRQRLQLEAVTGKAKEAYDQQAEAAERLKKAEEDYIKNAKNTKKTDLGMGLQGLSPAEYAKQEVEAARAFKKEADRAVDGVEARISSIHTGKAARQELVATIDRQKRIMASADKLGQVYKQAEETLTKAQQELANLDKKPLAKTFTERLAEAEEVGALRLLKSLADTDDKLEELQKKVREKAGGAVRGSREKKQLDKLEADLNYALGKRTKQQRDAEKVGPAGSISYWENVVKLADETLSKLVPGKDDTKITEQLNRRVYAEYQAEVLRKRYAVKSFEEELAEKERLYSVYQNYLTAYGKESADAQFKDLLKNGASYLEYLNAQIKNLEDQRSYAGLTDKEAGYLVELTNRRNAFTNAKTPLDNYVEGLKKAQVESVSLADYLTKLKAKQDELNTSILASSTDYFKKQEAVATEIVQTEQQLKDLTTQFLQNSASSGQQELTIKRKYNDLKLGLDKKYNNETSAAYYQALDDINTKELEEFEQFKQRKLEESQAYKATTKVILEEGRKALKIQIDRQKAVTALAFASYGGESEVYKRQLKVLDDLTDSLSDDTLTVVNEFAGQIGRLGESLSELGGDAGSVGRLFVGLAANTGPLTKAFKAIRDDASAADKALIGLEAALSLINIITSSTQQRKQAEDSYYRSAIAQQIQLNQLLVQQIGLQSEMNESVFTKDYDGRIKDRVAQYQNAQSKLEESFKKLNEGMLKVGTDSKVNWGNVGKGAVAGATLGTIFPLIGTVIGAVGGALAGLFAGKESQDKLTPLLAVYPELIQKSADGVLYLNKNLAQTLIDNNLLDQSTQQLVQSTLDWQKQVDEAHKAIKEIISDLAGNLGSVLSDGLVTAFREGTSAAEAFGKATSQILEDLLAKMIFSRTLGPALKQLEDDITESWGEKGDGSVIDDFGRFYGKAGELTQKYNEAMSAALKEGEKFGFNLFKPALDNPLKNPNSLTGAYQSLSEATGNVLVGQFNALRITSADTNAQIRQQLLVLNDISNNTYHIRRTNELLLDVRTELKAMSKDPLRGVGNPG